MSSQFEQVRNWLLNSGLYVSEKSDEQHGGVHSFYDMKERKFGFLYPEITGYYISTMRFLYTHEKKQQYLDYAKASSDWLTKIYKNYGTIIQGISSEPSQQKLAYSFDISICAKGLMDYYILSNDDSYLKTAKEMMVSVMEDAVEVDGTIKPFKSIDSKKFSENNDVWYKQKGCLHIKNAMTFCQLYKITKEMIFLECAEKICNSYSLYQQVDGSLSMHQNKKTINLHTLCYALEGLLFTFSVTKNPNYLQSCINAVNWCKNVIQEDGSIEIWFNSKYRAKASYPIAQLLRILLLLDKLNNTHEHLVIANRLSEFLLTFQYKDNKTIQNGALYEEFYKSVFGWKMRQRLNSWGSMFALQALYWHDKFDEINFDEEIELLY